MRDVQLEDSYIYQKVYKQLTEMDFRNYLCSPLVNGACGMGKTSAFFEPQMYELFKQKLGKEYPKILIIESRSATRDQNLIKNTNPNIYIEQFNSASRERLYAFDIIIIDEAHSLFSDSEFATRVTTPLAEWLRKNLCFQIYITASDEEFISYAEKYFIDKEFNLTFPDLTEVHVRYLAEKMYVSLTTEKVSTVIARKEDQFFHHFKKGLFFVISAQDAVNLYNYYSEMGYRCGFYVSQQNETRITKKEETGEDESDDFYNAYCSREITIDVLKYYHVIEQQRKNCGLITIRQALLDGHFPADIDYLFMTSVGQEGISLYDMQMDFVFIEDTYPLSINQKLFRYRNNIEEAYIHLPQRRIEQSLRNTIERLLELYNADQEYLKGYYDGSGGYKRKGLAKAIWFDQTDGLYKVSESYMAYVLTKSEFFRELRDNKDNAEWIRDNYGQYAKVFEFVNGREDKRKDILCNFFKDKDGQIADNDIREQWAKELKELGLNNKEQKKDYSFQFVRNTCEELNICKFEDIRIGKKHLKTNPNLKLKSRGIIVKFINNTDFIN